MEDELHDLIIYQSRYFGNSDRLFFELNWGFTKRFFIYRWVSEAVYQMGQKSKNDHKQSDKYDECLF